LFRGDFKVDWTKGTAMLDLGSNGSQAGHDTITDFERGVDKIRFAISGSSDDKSIFTKSLMPRLSAIDVPTQDFKFADTPSANVWDYILTQNGNKLIIGEIGAINDANGLPLVTGDKSWSITLDNVFDSNFDLAKLKGSLGSVFEVV